MINFKSESANKTQQNNAKILFGSKGVTVLNKLEEYSKEKALSTVGIDAVLEVLKTKYTELLEKFAASKTGKTLASNCKKLASAKTFAAIIKNTKAIKVLKSFDKFSTVSSPVKLEDQSPAVKDFGSILASLYAKDSWEEYTAEVENLTQTKVKEAGIADNGADEGLYVTLKNGNTAYFVGKSASKRFFRKLGVSVPVDLIYVDTMSKDGPYSGDPDIVPGTLLTAKTASQRAGLFKTFMTWFKQGVRATSTGHTKAKWVDMSPKGKATHYIERDIVAKLDSKNRFDLNDEETSDMVDLLKMSKVSGVEVIDRSGPAGGNPFVRIVGTRTALNDLINEFESEGDPDARNMMPIKPLKSKPNLKDLPRVTLRVNTRASAKGRETTSQINSAVKKASYYYVHNGATYLFDDKGVRVRPYVTAVSKTALKGLVKLPKSVVSVKPQK
jgi:hypothetical protein